MNKTRWCKLVVACACLMLPALPVLAKPAKKDKAREEAEAAAAAMAALASASASASSSAAPAAPPLGASLTGEAKTEYEAGRLLYSNADYANAAVKFRRAHELSKDARLLWNVAVCEKQQRHYAITLGLVRRYQKEAAGTATAEELREAADLEAAIKSAVGTLRVKVSEEGADVLVDDVKVGVTPLEETMLVDMGTRKVRVVKEGFVEAVKEVWVRGDGEVEADIKLQKVVTEGRLRVVAKPLQNIYIDGKLVGDGQWEGKLKSGGHQLRVTAPGMRPHQVEVVIEEKKTREMTVTLERDEAQAAPASRTWLWVTGGVVLAGGLAVGGYFLFRKSDEPSPPSAVGSMSPGTVQLQRW
jgi:hypothetical protein